MNKEHEILWDKIQNFEIDDPDASFTFTDKIVKEYNWSLGYTLRAIFEYKKFIFLIVSSKTAQTPSTPVDLVWHMHLLYTKSYWIDFCKATLGTDIHHNPSKGNEENGKHKNQYSDTLKLYKDRFNEEPPEDIWGNSQVLSKQKQKVTTAIIWQKITNKITQ